MNNRSTKTHSRKRKIILIGAIASLGVIILGVGLGVGLNDSESESNPTTPSSGVTTTTIADETYWKVVEETDPIDSTKQLKTLRIKKEVTTEAQLNEVNSDLNTNGIDRTTINELHLPYHLKTTFTEYTEEKVKVSLNMNDFNVDNIGYILHEADYREDIAIIGIDSTSGAGGYKNQKLVEVNLPENIEKLRRNTFYNNKIKKVNWSELTELKIIEEGAFETSKLTGDLDLSALTSLTSLGDGVFIDNNLNGTLTLPPNIKTIGRLSFNSIGSEENKINGTLKLPKSLVSIGQEAFLSNEIEVLDWSEAESLETIGQDSFKNNKIKTLTFSKTQPPKIKEIGKGAFESNPGTNQTGNLITTNIVLPNTLKTIGKYAIKAKDGIEIIASVGSNGITNDSFEGDKYTIIKG